jgi:histidine triad (HIT) family protein
MAECRNCSTIKGKNGIIYEDAACLATLPDRGATLGHIKVFSRQHMHMLEQGDDELCIQLMSVASAAAMAVFEAVAAQGTNIIINNGIGDEREHITINIVPRKGNDGLDFMWKGKQSSMDELEAVKQKLVQHTQFLSYQEGMKKPQPHVAQVQAAELPENAGQEEKEEEEDEDDFRIRQLDRIP